MNWLLEVYLQQKVRNEKGRAIADPANIARCDMGAYEYIPPAIPGDLDNDGDVDRDDLNIILSARNTPASGVDDPRDLDGDGMITALDARKLVLLCTCSRCVCP